MTYNQFAINIKKEFGINLLDYKSNQMQRRIQNLMDRLRCKDFGQYLRLLKENTEVRNKFIKHITINVTEFFRNPALFAYLRKEIIPSLTPKRGALKIWSAGCSNGAESYSLAILMQETLPGKGYIIEATDIDDDMLLEAKNGKYSFDCLKNLPKEHLEKYLMRKKELFWVKPSLKSKILFRKHNLLLDPYPDNCDLIVCRNVMIYFTLEAQNHCYQSFARVLSVGGVLFTGTSENFLNHKKYGFERIHPSFYRKL